MLPVFYRKTEEIPLYDAVEGYVVRNFGPREFESVKSQIQKLNEQRIEIAKMESVDDVLLLENYEKMLISYYIGMSFIQKKFTFGAGEDCVKLTFPWKDSQTKEKKISKDNLSLELNSVLYNLAAVMNNICVYTPIEGAAIKTVSQKFQEAAWLFDHIKKTSDSLPPSCRSHDFTVENLMYYSTIQLAQSQYCFFKKAESGGMSGEILAKITYQLKSFFEDAAKYCSASKVLSKGGYLTNTQFYVAYYNAIAHYYKGLQMKEVASENGSGMGIAEGHLKHSLNLLNGATTHDARTKDSLSERLKTITSAYKDVQEVNKNVYFEGCKDLKSLEKIDSKNFTLHRSIEVKLNEDYPGAENFEIFLPMEVRKLEGEFQQQANAVINQYFEELQKLSADEDDFLAQYGLPQAIYSMSSQEEVPEDLWKRVSEFQQKGNFQYLESLLQGVGQNRKTCFDIVGKCDQALVGEENEDNDMRTTYSTKWQRLPSSSLNGEIKTRIESYKANLDKAFETDSTVESNLEIIKPKMNLLKLSRNELTNEMPKSATASSEADPCVSALETLISQLTDLKTERENAINTMTGGLESAELRKDLFAVYQGGLDKKTAFDRHLDGLNEHQKVVEDHSTRSAEILSSIDNQITAFNKLKAKSKGSEKLEFFANIDEGLKAYYENMNLLSNGAKFYKQMHTYLTSLHLYINDFVASRQVEKDDMIQQLNGGGGGGYSGAPGTPYDPSFLPQHPGGSGHYQ